MNIRISILGIVLLSSVLLAFSWTKFTPPGTVAVSGIDFRVDQREITNLDWLEMLVYYKQREQSEQMKALLPDRDLWSACYQTEFSMQPTQVSHRDFPVVGVSREQVMHYCQWRSDRVFEKYGKRVAYELLTSDDVKELEGKYGLPTNQSEGAVQESEEAPKTGKVYGLFSNVPEMLADDQQLLSASGTRAKTTKDLFVGFRCKVVRN